MSEKGDTTPLAASNIARTLSRKVVMIVKIDIVAHGQTFYVRITRDSIVVCGRDRSSVQ
jgi:hypothetical protein